MIDKPLITILTPTYNREGLLPQLYDSLCRQTFTNFEWIIVDDGSTDGTEKLFNSARDNQNSIFRIQKSKFKVQYIKKANGGKHTAVNLGVTKASGALILILDSDDELPPNAIETISKEWIKAVNEETDNKSPENKPLCGICGYMSHRNGEIIGNRLINIRCDELQLKYKYHVIGDMCEIFRTDVLRKFPFPEIKGEKFCPEDLVWDRIAKSYSLYIFPKVIYLRDYIEGGLTDNIIKIRVNSPISSCMTYAELIEEKVPLKVRLKSAINYWRFRFCYRHTEENKDISIPKLSYKWLWTAPLGWLMHINDLRKINR